MTELEFKRGGRVVFNKWMYDHDKGEGHYEQVDLTNNMEWIHKRDRHVSFDEDVTLYDLFLFIEREPEVCDIVFTNCFIKEYVTAFKKAQVQFHQTQVVKEPSDEDVEYLEVHWAPELQEFDGRKTIDGIDRPWFHGIGVVRQNDSEYYKAGERTTWGVDFMPLHEILGLPVQLNTKFELRDDMHDPKYRIDGKFTPWKEIPILVDCHREFTLHNALEAVFWELSFYGTEEEKQEQKDQLDGIMDDLDLDNNSIDDLKSQGKIKSISFSEEMNDGYINDGWKGETGE